MNAPLRTAVLISGGGTTLRNLIEKQRSGELAIDIRLVVSSRRGVGGLAIAEQAGIPTVTLLKKQYPQGEEYSDAVFGAVRSVQAELVIMGGFLQHALIPADFENRVINIHPSLIPSFCGAGFYGHHVHEAVIAYGAKLSGCTAHFVDNHYDNGPVICQRSCPVLEEDTPTTLAARVFELECEVLPEAIRLFAEKRLEVHGRRVSIKPRLP